MTALDRSIPLVDLVFKYAAGRCSYYAVDAELRKQESAFCVELRAGDTGEDIPGYTEIPGGGPIWTKYVTGDFYDFLDRTHAVMHGMFVSDLCHVLVGGRYRVTATARAWGQIYAEWANSRSWLGQSDWDYALFYTGAISEEFGLWSDAFYSFLRRRKA